MLLVSTPSIQSRSPPCDSAISQFYPRHCVSPRFSESSPFNSPVLTSPSPLRQQPLFPSAVASLRDSGDSTQSPYAPTPSNPLVSKPQPIAIDDKDGSIFLSSGPSVSTTQPLLLTPVRPSHRSMNRSVLGPRSLDAVLSLNTASFLPDLDPGARTGLGTKRKSTIHCTPLRRHNLTPLKLAPFTPDNGGNPSFQFDRLAPLPTPKTNDCTPKTKAETEFYLRRHTATLTRLRISDCDASGDDFDNSPSDSGCEIDEDEANTLFLSNARMKHKVASLGLSAGRALANKGKTSKEVAAVISPGGHVTKRRARSRPVSPELKQYVRSPGRVSSHIFKCCACSFTMPDPIYCYATQAKKLDLLPILS